MVAAKINFTPGLSQLQIEGGSVVGLRASPLTDACEL